MSFTIAKGYIAKAPLSNSAEQMTKIMEWISKDAGPMIPVKNKEGLDLLNAVQKDVKDKKCDTPLLKLGLDGGNLVLRVEGKPKYEKFTILVKAYENLKTEREKATVVNAQKGDAVIDDASKDMAKIKGTKAQSSDDVDLNKKGSTAPIIILAHGTPTGSLPGSVYAKEFAQKKPDEIVTFLVDDKKLAKNYAGVIYLDGCYTAAGPKQGKDPAELTNFAKRVYDQLLSKGYKYLQVKGNLGRAATLADGTENVLDAQEEAKHNQRLQELRKLYAELSGKADDIKKRVEKLSQTAANLVARHVGNAESLKADLGVKLVKEEVEKMEVERAAAQSKLSAFEKEFNEITKKMKPTGEFRVDNLVGVFGPAKLASEPWYKKLFG
jgi:hypothetical protein